MSTAKIAAKKIKSLELEDVIILETLEKALDSYLSVPNNYLSDVTKIHQEEIEYRTEKLRKLEFIAKEKKGNVILTQGLDALALETLVKKGLISVIGNSLGVGKESDVFEVFDDEEESYAIKFYRIGRISFRQTRRKRVYVSPDNQRNWLRICIEAAKKEMKNLINLSKLGVSVPYPIAREKHSILMNKIDGKLISDQELINPPEVLEQILESVMVSYTKADLINGDLSQFNILFDGETPYIIDWPQSINTKHPNSEEILTRDIKNILTFFKRKYNVEMNEDNTIEYVKGLK